MGEFVLSKKHSFYWGFRAKPLKFPHGNMFVHHEYTKQSPQSQIRNEPLFAKTNFRGETHFPLSVQMIFSIINLIIWFFFV